MEEDEVAKWLTALTPAASDDGKYALPLRNSVRSLADAMRAWNVHRHEALAAGLKNRVEQALRRYCDQAWYAAGVDPAGIEVPPPAAQSLATALDLTEAEAVALVTAARGTLPATALQLIVEGLRNDSFTGVDSRELARLTCEWAALSSADGQQERLARLARTTSDLCEVLLKVTEDADGREAE
jgi:hypothetical protein